MDRKYTILIVILIAVSIIIGAGLFQFSQWKQESYESTYTYELNIYTNRTDIDFSMIFPLALKNNEAIIDEDTFQTQFEQQENWTVKFIDTRYGTMLQINGILTSERHDITINLDSDERIDTKKAVDKEPTLQPKENMTKSSYDDPHPEEWDERIDAYEYTSFIYVQLEEGISADLSINPRFEGRNEWWVLGWSGNEYWDRIYLDIQYDEPGWYQGNGKIVDGLGNYD